MSAVGDAGIIRTAQETNALLRELLDELRALRAEMRGEAVPASRTSTNATGVTETTETARRGWRR